MAEETNEKDKSFLQKKPLDDISKIPDVISVFTPAVKETKAGGIKVDPAKTTPSFNFNQVFTSDFFKNIEKDQGSKLNAVDNYQFKTEQEAINLMNTIGSPRYLRFDDPNKPPIDIFNLVDQWNTRRIEELRAKEKIREPSIIEQIGLIDPIKDVKVTPSYETISKYGDTRAIRAKHFLNYLDKLDLDPITKVKLINRQVLGEGEDAQTVFSSLGLGDKWRDLTNVAEKATLRVAELPRTAVDILGTIYGFAAQGVYKTGRNLLEVGEFVPEDFIPKYDQAGNVESRGVFQDLFLLNGDSRDALRRAIGPDAIGNYQRLLAQDGIILNKADARKVMNFNFSATGRFFEHAPALGVEVMTFLGISKKAAKKTFEELKKLEATNPVKPGGEKYTKQEILNTFVKQKTTPWLNFMNLHQKIISGRIKKGMDLDEFQKPIEERLYVQEAKKNLDIARENLQKNTEKFAPRDLTIVGDELIQHPKIKSSLADVELKKVELFLARNRGNTPSWVIENYRDTAVFAGLVGYSGQIMQNMGFDSDFAYLNGAVGTLLFGGGTAFLTKGSAINKYLDMVNPETAKVMPNYFNLVDSFGFESKEELVSFLRNPNLDRIDDRKLRGAATKLATTINTLNEDVRPQVIANIEYYYDLKQRLKDKGISPDLLTEGLGSITGISFFSAIEDTFITSIDASSIMKKDTMQTFLTIQNKRAELQRNLVRTYDNLFQTKNLDLNDPEIKKLQTSITGMIDDMKRRHGENSVLMENFLAYKTKLIQRVLDGTVSTKELSLVAVDKDPSSIVTRLNEIHKDLLDDSELYLAHKLQEQNIGPLSVADDIKRAEDIRNDILDIKKKTSEYIGENLQIYDDNIRDELFNIEDLLQTKIVTDKTGQALIKDGKAVTSEKLAIIKKYNNEDATLARMVLIQKNNRANEARIPLIEFDAKYQNLRTDATEFIFDYVKEFSKIPEGTGQLIGKELPNMVGSKIFRIFDIRAKQALEKYGIAPNEVVAKMVKKAEEDGVQLNTNDITSFDLLQFVRSNDNLDIGIGLSMQDTSHLYDFFSSKAATSANIAFAKYANKVENELFTNIIDTNGDKLTEGSEVFKELSKLKNKYFSLKIGVFDKKGKTSFNWSNPKKAADKGDNIEHPGGMEWSKDNHPRTWLNENKLIKADENDIADLNKTIIETFGDVVETSGGAITYTITKNNVNRKNLTAIANLKYAKGIKEIHKKDLDEQQTAEAVKKLTDNIRKTFQVTQPKEGGEIVESLFNSELAQKEYFELSVRARHNKKIRDKKKLTEDELNVRAEKQASVIKNQMKKLNDKIQFLINNQNFSTNEQFFNFYFKRSDGIDLLNKYRDELVDKNLMTKEDFNEAAKTIFSRHIKSKFSKDTGRKNPIFDEKGNVTTENVMDTDFEELNKFIKDKELQANMLQSGYFDKDHHDTLTLINEVLARQRRVDVQRAKIDGVPTGLSIESYISRFYAINRDVVSARYVGTESIIQTLRMNKHRLLVEMFQNKDVAEAMADIIVRNKKLPEKRAIQVDNILKTIAVKSIVEYNEQLREDVGRGQVLRKDLPKSQEDLKEQMENIGIYGQPMFQPIRIQ
tara:strand:- start:19 stop:4791 length:4773 start_codon:yes stop_codon:yes gene_type:complete